MSNNNSTGQQPKRILAFINIQLLSFLFCFSLCFFWGGRVLWAQSPGQIVRPAGGNGITLLNPDGNAFSSQSVSGFTSNDLSQSELPFVLVPPMIIEPTGDVRTGPQAGFTDIVQTIDGSGFYIYSDGTNLFFRLRIGNIVSGSKGYSILIDTDQRMGATGAAADPNFVASSNLAKGNPGFEFEVVLETNFRVAVYAVDGTSTPGNPIATYPLSSHMQISRALTNDGGNPDYFYDWYVPWSIIGNPTSVRLVATTVTSPSSALQGSRSDIYGIDDQAYADQAGAWEAIAKSQPLISSSNPIATSPVCTQAPVITGPISTGASVAVSGTWTRLDATKPSAASISLFRNGNLVGSTSVTSGQSWSIAVSNVLSGDVFTARAQAVNESQCLYSNIVIASACNVAPTAPSPTCGSLKGISGTIPSTALGNSVEIYLLPITNASPTSNLVSNGTNLTYPSATSFAYFTNGCSGGNNNVVTGVYMVVTKNNGCFSPASFVCVTSGSSTVTPPSTNALTITTPLFPSTTTVNGSGAVAGEVLRLFINGIHHQSITATGSSFTFTGLNLKTNDQLVVYSQSGSNCITMSATFTVRCFTQAPSIVVSSGGTLLSGSTSIAGTSIYPGATVQVYRGVSPSGTAVGSAVLVNSSGSWSTTVPALQAAENYYAIQTVNGCSSSSSSSASVQSSTVCPTITGTYTPTSTQVNGTMPSSFSGTIRVYVDGFAVASQSFVSVTNWTVSIPTNYLYAGAELRATAQASGSAESANCSGLTIPCGTVLTPSITPSSTTILEGQHINLNVDNVQSSTWYSLADAASNSYATARYTSNTQNISLTSIPFPTAGIFNLQVKADDLSGCPSSFSAFQLTVQAATLPVRFLSFQAQPAPSSIALQWKVDQEVQVAHYAIERSTDCSRFEPVGIVSFQAAANGSYQFIDHHRLSGVSCYRIRQVDIDGAFQFSKTIRILPLNEAQDLKYAPNPAKNHVVISWKAGSSASWRVDFLNASGKIVRQWNVKGHAGMNNIDLNLAGLPNGVYVLRLESSETNAGAGTSSFLRKIMISN